jgi:hypothetical protein
MAGLGLAAALVGGGRIADARQSRSAAPPVSLMFSGEISGYLTPCGCTSPMLGGMERRAAVLSRLRQTGPVIVVENGDLTEAAGRQDEIKAEALAGMLSAMKYEAVAVGEMDLALGFATLVSLEARVKTPFVCANVTDGAGNALFRPSVTITRTVGAKRLKVGITSALSPRLADMVALPPGEFRVPDPRPPLKRVLAGMEGVHVRVLLFHGLRDEAAALVRRLPRLDLVICAHSPDPPPAPMRIGRTLLVGAGSRGMRLNVASVAGDGKIGPVRQVPLDEATGADRTVAGMKRQYLDRVAAEDLLALMPRSPAPGGASYAGSKACASCHAEAARAWQSSAHATALSTLVDRHEDRDPECVPCHVTGAKHEGGYRCGDDRLAGVGCESCHGPSSAHARSGSTPLPSREREASCTPCHVPDHSPSFRFHTYWPKIRH